MRLELGASVRCTDEELGDLADVVIDPTTKRITHLVVRPHHELVLTRLVPIDLAEEGDGDELSLRATVAEVRELAPVQEVEYVRLGEFPVDDPDWDVGIQSVLAMPYYEGGVGPGYGPDTGVVYDRVPKGDVEIRRASAVISGDGHHLGHVDGFVVDKEHITHIVLERGHLWGRREVTIPIGAVDKVETDVVTLRLTRDEVGELGGVAVRRWRD